MRYALISDVHANLPALETALALLADSRLDGYLCAGDLIGYGPHPDECVERLRSIGAVCVAGNHDLMAVDRLPNGRADELASTTLAWTRQRIGDQTREYIAGLPLVVRVGEITIAHGSLDDPEEYVRDRRAAADQLTALARDHPDATLLLLGHTHRPAAYAEDGGRLAPRRDGAVVGPEGKRWLLNPGSIGQARERRALVRFAVLDLERREARFHAVGYDDERVRRDLAAAGLPERAIHRRPRVRSRVRRALERLVS